jgi:hypothetical protein
MRDLDMLMHGRWLVPSKEPSMFLRKQFGLIVISVVLIILIIVMIVVVIIMRKVPSISILVVVGHPGGSGCERNSDSLGQVAACRVPYARAVCGRRAGRLAGRTWGGA